MIKAGDSSSHHCHSGKACPLDHTIKATVDQVKKQKEKWKPQQEATTYKLGTTAAMKKKRKIC